jgi:hypothetical protein
VTKDLLKELGKVKKDVLLEYQRLEELSGSNTEKDLVTRTMRKRLLYLFVRDLSSGVSGEVLSSKFRRDSQMGAGSVPGKLNRVSWKKKWMAGLFVGLLDTGMLFYVYLFAMNQTRSRQQAWFVSFVMWLGFEIFLSSTALVLVLHLLIPLYVWSDVSEVKEKVLTDLLNFREKYLKRNDFAGPRVPVNDIETGTKDFNAAKYLFTSWRVACLFPELPESPFVLRFSTPWPKRKFGKEATVANEYEDDVLLSAASRILLYFLTSLLHYSSLVQDILIQTVCNGGLGYVCVLLVQLWNSRPILTGLVVFLSLLCLFYLGRLSLSDLANKLEEEATRVEFQAKQPLPSLEEGKEIPSNDSREQPPPAAPPPPLASPANSVLDDSVKGGIPSLADVSGSSDSDVSSRDSYEISEDASDESSDWSSDLDLSASVG